MTDLKEKAKQIRRDILNSSFEAGACHIGSALSCVDILVELFYGGVMKEKDQFIFSKASGASAYYAILADLGYFPKDKLAYYLHEFPECSKEVPGVIHSVGSVGMGLSVAAGMAYGDRTRDVYCLISDGECQEGVTYETALFANHHSLTNLKVICDDNGLQACGKTSDIINLSPAFCFLQMSLPRFERITTKKGQGVSFMEGDYNWHYRNLSKELLDKALKQI